MTTSKCMLCRRPMGMVRLRRWLFPYYPPMPPDPEQPGWLTWSYNRCLGCARRPVLATFWACGVGPRRSRHERHRWRWSMRLCQLLHGRDAQGEPQDAAVVHLRP